MRLVRSLWIVCKLMDCVFRRLDYLVSSSRRRNCAFYELGCDDKEDGDDEGGWWSWLGSDGGLSLPGGGRDLHDFQKPPTASLSPQTHFSTPVWHTFTHQQSTFFSQNSMFLRQFSTLACETLFLGQLLTNRYFLPTDKCVRDKFPVDTIFRTLLSKNSRSLSYHL